jgi:hypothetical protein
LFIDAAEVDILNDGRRSLAESVERRRVYETVRDLYEQQIERRCTPLREPVEPRASQTAQTLPDLDRVWTVVSGGSGVSASKQAGIATAFAREAFIGKAVVSSGGSLAWIPALVGMTADEIRDMNAGVPTAELRQAIPGVRGLDLAGRYEMTVLRDWFHAWMQWAGTPTFADLRFPAGAPTPVPGPLKNANGEWRDRPDDPYRLSVGLTVWELGIDAPLMSQEALDDPRMVRRILRQEMRDRKPLGRMRQRFFPNDVAEEFPWIDADSTAVADVVHWSCLRWPVFVPKLLQDPSTRIIKAVFDGASLDTHPDLWMSGFQPIWSTGDAMRVFVSRGKRNLRRPERQAFVDQRARPWVVNHRSRSSGFSPLAFHRINELERDAMFLAGVHEGMTEVRSLIRDEVEHKHLVSHSGARRRRAVVRPPLHGANLLLQQRKAWEWKGHRQFGW